MAKRRRFSFKNHTLDESLINLTPLIDVVFVVLIAFILIAPLIDVDNIDLAASTESSKSDLSRKSKIAIYVRPDDSIWVNKRAVTDEELVPFLSRLKNENPGCTPQLYHDKKATFGTYQKIKGASERAGFQSLDVILKGN